MELAEFPSELQERMLQFHTSIEKIKSAMKFITEKSSQETREELDPLEKAKYDLVCAFVLNSLFWMHLNTKGEDPSNHGIKQELERIQGYMGKVKQLIDKPKAPKLDIESSKRMLLHSLWTPKEKNQSTSASGEVQGVEGLGEKETTEKPNSTTAKKSNSTTTQKRNSSTTTKEKRSKKKLRRN